MIVGSLACFKKSTKEVNLVEWLPYTDETSSQGGESVAWSSQILSDDRNSKQLRQHP